SAPDWFVSTPRPIGIPTEETLALALVIACCQIPVPALSGRTFRTLRGLKYSGKECSVPVVPRLQFFCYGWSDGRSAMLEKTGRSALSAQDQRTLTIRRIDAIPVALPLKVPMKMSAETIAAA